MTGWLDGVDTADMTTTAATIVHTIRRETATLAGSSLCPDSSRALTFGDGTELVYAFDGDGWSCTVYDSAGEVMDQDGDTTTDTMVSSIVQRAQCLADFCDAL